MHEMGTVVYIIDTVNKLCEENNIDKVLYVKVQVGEVSGIIPSYLTDFWEWAVKKEKHLSGAELKVEELKAVTRCGNCGKTYETVKYAKICPYCKSVNTWLETGYEYIIKEIAVPDEEGQ